jgi:hypothetical protein
MKGSQHLTEVSKISTVIYRNSRISANRRINGEIVSNDHETRVTVSSGIPGLPLAPPADSCIRELIAFYEITQEIVDDGISAAEDWITVNRDHITKDDLKEIQELFRQMGEAVGEAASHMADKDSVSAAASFKREIPVERKEMMDILSSFMYTVIVKLDDRSKLVSRAFLIASESSFEILFSRLARVIFRKNPAALNRSDYSFTLEQLSSYDSIDMAREALVTHKVEALLRESIDEWGKWLKRTTNIVLDDIMEDWPTTREIFIRRNMLVHTDGEISKRYIDELRNAGVETADLAIGQSLVPSTEYLQVSLQRLIALSVLLTFRVWSRLEKKEIDVAAGWLGGNVELLVSRRMWTSVCLISRKLADVNCRRSTKLAIQISGWLARKKRDGVESIESEVIAWDVSGLEGRYKVIKDSLLDSISAEEIEEAVLKGFITRFEMSTHPLFDRFHVAQPVLVQAEPGQLDSGDQEAEGIGGDRPPSALALEDDHDRDGDA